MSTISIRLPDGNIHNVETQSGQAISLRNFFLSFGQHLPPYEVSLLLDENTNSLVSKSDNLKANVPYKLIDGRELIKCYNTFKDRSTKGDKQILDLQQKLTDLQQKLNEQQLEISREEKQKLEDIQNKYKELESQLNSQKEQNLKLQQERNQAKQQYKDQKQKVESLEKLIYEEKMQFENEKKQFEIEKKQIEIEKSKMEEEKKHLEKTKKKYKKQMKELLEERSKFESKISGLEKDVQYKSEKITEIVILIQKLEDQLNKQREEYKTFYQQQLSKEADRVKEAELRQRQLEQNQAQILRSTGNLVALQQNQDNFNQDNQIQQDYIILEQRIRSYEDQVIHLNNQINNQDNTIKELNDNSKTSKSQKEELEQKVLQLDKQISEQEIRLKNLNKLIDDVDSENLKMQGKVEQIDIEVQNNYMYRLRRLVELIPRTYRDKIEFAVEELFEKKLYQDKGQVTNQSYKFYVFDYPKVKHLILEESNLDIKQSIITSYKFNIHGQLTSEKIKPSKESQDNSGLFDSLQLFYTTSIDHLSGELVKIKSEKSDKIYVIKDTYTTESSNIGSQDYALDQLSRSIVAQIILNEFLEDLKKKNINVPFNFQFAQPALFSNSVHFKQYFLQLVEKQPKEQQTMAFSLIVQFLQELTDDNSNEFYSFIREQQHLKTEQQIIEPDKQNQIDFLTNFNAMLLNQNFQNIVKKYNECSNEERLKAFQYLLELLTETCDDFPLEKYYYGYELKLSELQDANVFRKYNGGTLQFDASEEGKFLSALSYYSIKKTQNQFCVSHLQGIGNYLYDPMVSSYDGFLNCLDQGINEMRIIESSFESCDPQCIGLKYIEALGITMQ
ncbi:unnamed protein product (macronuclear) [Paramecium tetraurelia]|uniref:Alpha-type protein kinase domain-containing protein n=1 Tax=Paramecium tetraurelia TaxID=5888 RepID=A0CFD3_PARTE|nr:uncharacterized protein GSPATT00037939001 [Paramecium tetraurelia]CAK69500.1 unnamed protein product [Paramecium tetraurelia]|eukprot:XP_001436897.1 hypothetical protein (macronuclear) [Paramecium tetraurelia strain d4-2]